MFQHRTRNNFSREDRLLLDVLRNAVSEKGATPFQKNAESPFNWDYFLDRAYCHKIIPIIYTTMKHTGLLHAIPQDIQGALHKGYLQSFANNAAYAAELFSIMKTFYDEGIDCLVLKGAAFALGLYNDIGLRMFADIDLLVQFTDLEAIDKVLTGQGYALFEEYRPRDYFEMFHFHYVYVKKTEAMHYTIEIHWDLFPPLSPIHFDLHSLWERKLTLETGTAPIQTLQWDDHFLYLCAVHCAHDKLSYLVYFYDLIHLSRKIADGAWRAVERKASLWGIEKAVACCAHIIKETFGVCTPFPADQYLKKPQKFFLGSVALGSKLVQQYAQTDWTLGALMYPFFFNKTAMEFIADYLYLHDERIYKYYNKIPEKLSLFKRLFFILQGVKSLAHIGYSMANLLILRLFCK